MKETDKRHHFVAIFGGAVAGSEAAYQLSRKGFTVAVFEQSMLPYGKIEDGLPKWHHKLRDQEASKIDEKLDHPGISFVPGIRLGRDIAFEEIVRWGFSAIILATGAWKDRPLPIEGIDDYIGKGLYYQNPLVIWFNHHHDPDFKGREHTVRDNAIVIGGGLASLDVVKILMLETVSEALRKNGIKTDILTLEKKGISKVLESHDLTMQDLGLKGCTLYYRRRAKDMPLSPMPTDSPEQLAKAEAVREKILDNFMKKYLFRFEPCCIPVKTLIDQDRIAGITFQRTSVENNKVSPLKNEYFDVESPLVISSIGSVPETIPGVPTDGHVFRIPDPGSCLIEGFDNVFAIGNAVTGKGNINESVKHSREISAGIIDNFLEWQQEKYQDWHRETTRDMDRIISSIEESDPLTVDRFKNILDKIRLLQEKAGYDGNYREWVEKHLPERYENLYL